MWVNWAGDQRCAPARLERPGSEEELAAVVAGSAQVRVAGSGHSFTDAVLTDGTLVDLSRMNRVLSVDGSLVTVEAGITLHDLGRELASRGLAMENQGDIDRQTLAGALATATHGTGARFRNLSSQVVGMRIVTGSGELVELAEGSDDLRAARVGVGSLGAVSAVTLRCVPLFTIRRVDEPLPLASVLDDFDSLADSHDHFEFYVFPWGESAIVRLSERSDRPPEPPGRLELWAQEVLLENVGMSALSRAGKRFPRLIPAIQRRATDAISRTVRTDYGYRVYASRRDVRFTEMEYAIPREHGPEAVRRVLDTVRRRRLPVTFPIEVRVVAGDDAFLSTAYERDTAYVAVHQYRGMEFEGYFRAVEAIMDSYGGRPHWGKRHYQSAATLAPRYPEWERFAAVRARLDPEGRFENDYARRVLGPVSSGADSGPG